MIRKDTIKTICIRLSNFRGIEIRSNYVKKDVKVSSIYARHEQYLGAVPC